MRCFILLALSLSLLLASLTLADTPSAGTSIEQLIEQLGHPDFRKRDRAGQLLEA